MEAGWQDADVNGVDLQAVSVARFPYCLVVKCGHLLWQFGLVRSFFFVPKTPGPKHAHFFHSGAGAGDH